MPPHMNPKPLPGFQKFQLNRFGHSQSSAWEGEEGEQQQRTYYFHNKCECLDPVSLLRSGQGIQKVYLMKEHAQ